MHSNVYWNINTLLEKALKIPHRKTNSCIQDTNLKTKEVTT